MVATISEILSYISDMGKSVLSLKSYIPKMIASSLLHFKRAPHSPLVKKVYWDISFMGGSHQEQSSSTLNLSRPILFPNLALKIKRPSPHIDPILATKISFETEMSIL